MNEQSVKRPIHPKVINKIFLQMTGRFGKVFTERFCVGIMEKDEDIGLASAKEVWGVMLAGFSMEDLTRGVFSDYKFPPSCDEFRMACRPAQAPDGRPTALEAWTMLPKRENHTRLVTDEMNRAAEGIGEMIESNFSTDQATAKAIFIERYDSMVKIAREQGKPAVWTISRGSDAPRDAMADGLLKGLLSFDYCALAFHPQEVEAAIELVKMKALPGNTVAMALLANPKVLALAPPEKTPEEIAATKRKARDAKDAIAKMLNRHNVDDDKWIDDGSIDPRKGKEK